MFRPNNKCLLSRRLPGRSVFGKPVFSPPRYVPCSIVKLEISAVGSSVRADSSASRGAAEETQADARFLFPPRLKLAINDVVISDGQSLRIVKIQPRYGMPGQLDHQQVEMMIKERDE